MPQITNRWFWNPLRGRKIESDALDQSMRLLQAAVNDPTDLRTARKVSFADAAGVKIVQPSDYFLFVDSTAGAVTINLPAAQDVLGQQFAIKRVGTTNAVTIDANGSELIDGALTLVLANQYDAVFLHAYRDGATRGWWTLPWFTGGGGGGGGITGAANINTTGVGVYDSLSGTTLQFRGVDNASPRVAVALNGANHVVTVDVVPDEISMILANQVYGG